MSTTRWFQVNRNRGKKKLPNPPFLKLFRAFSVHYPSPPLPLSLMQSLSPPFDVSLNEGGFNQESIIIIFHTFTQDQMIFPTSSVISFQSGNILGRPWVRLSMRGHTCLKSSVFPLSDKCRPSLKTGFEFVAGERFGE